MSVALSASRLPPLLDLRMVAREQHVRDLSAAKLRGPRIVRMVEQPVAEGIPVRRLFVSQNAGQEPCRRIDHHERREFAAGEHIVADRELFVNEGFDHPLIDGLIVSAEQDDPPLFLGELFRPFLIKEPALRREQDRQKLFSGMLRLGSPQRP